LEKMLYQKGKCTGGFQVSKIDSLPWKMKNTVDSHPHAQWLKILERVQELIPQDRCITTYLCENINPSYRSCQCILSEVLNMESISAKFVPHLLIDEQN